jgi:hypothetical protein
MFSLQRDENNSHGMLSWQENIALKFKGKKLCQTTQRVLNGDSPTLDLANLKALLLAPAGEEGDRELKFLNPSGVLNKVMYNSYSRSGNTFLRKYLE